MKSLHSILRYMINLEMIHLWEKYRVPILVPILGLERDVWTEKFSLGLGRGSVGSKKCSVSLDSKLIDPDLVAHICNQRSSRLRIS